MKIRGGATIILLISMIYQIAFQVFLGLPLVAWGGVATIVSLFTTATLGFLFHTGRAHFKFVWHIRAAVTTLTLAFLHGLLAILALLGF